ncbi:MAG: hypothetical protein PPP58_01510 [Natronomonas sp.]
MSSDTAEAPEETRRHGGESDTGNETDAVSEPLTIDLPDGSTSVADAIRTNRDALHNPSESGLATEEDIEHLSEAVEELSKQLQEETERREEAEAAINELEMTVSRQQRQIHELRSVVESLTEILGTSAEWDAFRSDETATEDTDD